MARIFITGSADGLGKAAAEVLLGEGHDVVVHARNAERLAEAPAGATGVTGDLSDLDQVRDLAAQVNALGRMDAVIHNAGVYRGPLIMPVNVVAPYVLTALIERPQRLIYLSSGLHEGGGPALDWTSSNYGDSKFLITAFTLALARRWPGVLVNAVNPGWVPTKMGGLSATDDLRLGHLTQEWLATSDDAEARTTGGYWFHQERHEPARGTGDASLQDRMIAALAEHTGHDLPSPDR